MSENYTEGPWIVDGLLVRQAENNEIICRIEPWSEDTDAADASLIAAAPDLLEVVRHALRILERDFPNGQFVIDARAAIAAATGANHEQ